MSPNIDFGSAAFRAVRLRLTGTFSKLEATPPSRFRGIASKITKMVFPGKAEPYRTECGKAAESNVTEVAAAVPPDVTPSKDELWVNSLVLSAFRFPSLALLFAVAKMLCLDF